MLEMERTKDEIGNRIFDLCLCLLYLYFRTYYVSYSILKMLLDVVVEDLVVSLL